MAAPAISVVVVDSERHRMKHRSVVSDVEEVVGLTSMKIPCPIVAKLGCGS
jgi:hypothetical protein